MDFSGKTTIINLIDNHLPGIFKLQSKFITNIETIEELRGKWLPSEDWKPLLQSVIKRDIASYRNKGLILQDSLWIIKYLATTLERNCQEDTEEIETLILLLKQYPNMDSFYLTAKYSERVNRFILREKSGQSITHSDRMLHSLEKFECIEQHYRSIVLRAFPNTRIIDTNNATPEQTAHAIMHDVNFLSNF